MIPLHQAGFSERTYQSLAAKGATTLQEVLVEGPGNWPKMAHTWNEIKTVLLGWKGHRPELAQAIDDYLRGRPATVPPPASPPKPPARQTSPSAPFTPTPVPTAKPTEEPSARTIGGSLVLTHAGHSRHLIQAIDDEIAAIRDDTSKGYSVYDGEELYRAGVKWVYLFRAEDELRVPSDTPARLRLYEMQPIDVRVVGVEGFDVYLECDEQLPSAIPPGALNVDLTFILVALKEQLAEPASWNEPLLGDLLLPKRCMEPNRGQDLAVRMACERRSLYIWGPPGTGKTSTIARIAEKSLQSGSRILIASHTNVAVDAAIGAILKRDVKDWLERGLILRVGVPVDQDILENPHVSPLRMSERLHPELAEKRRALEAERAELAQFIRTQERRLSSSDLRDKRTRLVEVKQELGRVVALLRQHERELIGAAGVVGTTLSKCILSPDLLGKFDTVLIDEASMAYIPQVVFLASLSTRGLIIVGDFRQLPPIAMAQTNAALDWLHRDIFALGKVPDLVEEKQPDARLVLLHVQHRMHPRISAICDRLAYAGRLHDSKNVEKQRQDLCDQLGPERGKVVEVIDLSELGTWALKNRQSSHFNPMSAAIAAAIAKERIGESQDVSIGIITPYVAQARLIRRLLWDWDIDRRITVSTVHRFQGHEKDVVIFDLVDSIPQKFPGRLINGTLKSVAMRLLNVAVSRARAKLIVLMDTQYLRNRVNDSSVLNLLLNYLKEKAGYSRLSTPWEHSTFRLDGWARLLEQFTPSAPPEMVHLPGPDGAIRPLIPLIKGSPCSVTLAAEWNELEREVPMKRSQFCVAPVLGRGKDQVWLGPRPTTGERSGLWVVGGRFRQGVLAESGLARL